MGLRASAARRRAQRVRCAHSAPDAAYMTIDEALAYVLEEKAPIPAIPRAGGGQGGGQGL